MKKLTSTKKHGLSRTKTNTLWKRLRQSCLNEVSPKYKDYGARGISMYKPWQEDFLSFHNYVVALPGYNDLKRGTPGWVALDRIDNDGNYEPGNLRWSADHSLHRANSRSRPIKGKGVHYNKNPRAKNKWLAYVDLAGRKRTWLGSYATEQLALEARAKYLKDHDLEKYTLRGERSLTVKQEQDE